MRSSLTCSDVKRIIGYRGGVFCLRYVRFDGEEVTEPHRVIGATYVAGDRAYLICDNGWIPLGNVREIEAYREAN